MQDIETLLADIFARKTLISATMSAPRQAGGISKVAVRPLLVKDQTLYQMTEHDQQQAWHRNLSQEECCNWLKQHVKNFKQSYFYTSEADYHLLIGKKGHVTLLKKNPTKAALPLKHNRQKVYAWQEGIPVPFLIHLGVMNAEGKVYAAKKDKFRQINRFLEIIEDLLPHLDRSRLLRVVDFGCGKAYLTFALYHFLKMTKGYQVDMIGLDLKRKVIQDCQSLAKTLGYEKDLHFVEGDINAFQQHAPVDLMVSLHACDTATDAALEKAIRWQANVILCVPCCQHELMPQLQQEALRPLLKHGIVKERFAALATDAARAQLLEILGYHAQIMEFIDIENTPKNLLIRAFRRSLSVQQQKSAWQAYLKFKNILNIDPSLERRFQVELKRLADDPHF